MELYKLMSINNSTTSNDTVRGLPEKPANTARTYINIGNKYIDIYMQKITSKAFNRLVNENYAFMSFSVDLVILWLIQLSNCPTKKIIVSIFVIPV